MVTSEQVAQLAGVSRATVSRVLNGVDVVKSSTRARVMKAVSEPVRGSVQARVWCCSKSAVR